MPSLVKKITFLFLTYIAVNLAGAVYFGYDKTCKDESLNCPLWKHRGYCHSEGSVGVMMPQLCKLSCGLCGPTQGGKCVDKNALCPTWQRVQQCDADMKDYMNEYCPVSCKICGEESCSDLHHACSILASIGYCVSEKQWAKINCRKTCGYCVQSAECGKSFLFCGSNNEIPQKLPSTHNLGNGWQGRIVGGDTTVHGEVPWQVLIDVMFIRTKGNNMFCGGAVLTQQWVLSAGHCFYRGWEVLKMSFGAVYNFNPLQVQRLEKFLHKENVILHPAYKHKIKNNDIALVKLVRPLRYTKEILPVCLPSPDDYQEGQTGIVTGWGTIAYKGRPSNLLLKVCLKVRDCNQFKVNFTITDNMICAYEEGKDACQGDSGGPLVARSRDGRFVLLGIVSKGKGCAMKDMPGAYTKVSTYLHWISKVTGNDPWAVS